MPRGLCEGTVETIGLQTTKVRRFDQAPVFVPNSYLADNAVTNFSQMTSRRISWIIGLDYSTTIGQLRDVRDAIEAYILGSQDFVHPPEAVAFVRVDKFNESSIDLIVYCFTRTTVWGDWLKIKEELADAIKAIVKKAGSDFAFPSQSLYVEAVPTGIELFPHNTAPSSDPTLWVRPFRKAAWHESQQHSCFVDARAGEFAFRRFGHFVPTIPDKMTFQRHRLP
ncbi:mechanosensitive ion channel [Bradyrhizobium sp. Arg68]|uniref:mechanosensitive ion channel family protein n=1 Tax=Bradyrhizobium ivorense TaxID=2511166 RepID=UPI0024C0BF1C|nr:mechanosensitive ion channel domain-containing protein [Bradyrhizobium ivorense]MCC8936173.1 mechanosensitive ion channel [Bradyrhizobium ivorense]